MRRAVILPLAVLLGVVVLSALAAYVVVVDMPGRSFRGTPTAPTAAERELATALAGHVNTLAGDIGERNLGRYEALCAAANYVDVTLNVIGLDVVRQSFQVDGRPVHNLVSTLPGRGDTDEIVVVGAHYDSAPGTPGANDNATGVAAMLEIARALAGRDDLQRTVQLVAFVNEEPPHFQTDRMGSLVHARSLASADARVVAMLSLETMGYYRDEPGSQSYPSPLSLVYPDRGDFVALVGNLRSRPLVRRAIGVFRRTTAFPSEGVAAPGGIPGIGWSDHWAFWQSGYPAVMITDTALFRYPFYHRADDTPDAIDPERLARVVGGVIEVVVDLAGTTPAGATRSR